MIYVFALTSKVTISRDCRMLTSSFRALGFWHVKTGSRITHSREDNSIKNLGNLRRLVREG